MTTLKSASTLIQCGAAALVLAFGSAAQAASTPLSNEYTVSSTSTSLGANVWKFDYTVLNNNQGANNQTGFDGFSLLIPDSAIVAAFTAPPPLNGQPGYWSNGVGTALELQVNGNDTSQNYTAPAGYKLMTFWGQYPQSVYTPGTTANFSVTLGNVSVGTNTAVLSTYWATSIPENTAFASNQYGNYTTYTTSVASALAVPEPASYGMMLAGLAMLGLVTRRRKN